MKTHPKYGYIHPASQVGGTHRQNRSTSRRSLYHALKRAIKGFVSTGGSFQLAFTFSWLLFSASPLRILSAGHGQRIGSRYGTSKDLLCGTWDIQSTIM